MHVAAFVGMGSFQTFAALCAKVSFADFHNFGSVDDVKNKVV